MISRGINLFDTADSYGAVRLPPTAACRAAAMVAAGECRALSICVDVAHGRDGAAERTERAAAGSVHSGGRRQGAGPRARGQQVCSVPVAPDGRCVCTEQGRHHRWGAMLEEGGTADMHGARGRHSVLSAAALQGGWWRRVGGRSGGWAPSSWQLGSCTGPRPGAPRADRAHDPVVRRYAWSTQCVLSAARFLLPCCRYAPLQERALWDGLAAIHNEAWRVRFRLVIQCMDALLQHQYVELPQ